MNSRKCVECDFKNPCVSERSKLCRLCDLDFKECTTCKNPCLSSEELDRRMIKAIPSERHYKGYKIEVNKEEYYLDGELFTSIEAVKIHIDKLTNKK